MTPGAATVLEQSMDTSTPTATADEIIYALHRARWPLGNAAPWGVEGVEVPGTTTYINSIDTHVEGDYRQWYLVEVCDRDRDATEHYINGELQPTETGEVWVSYLAVFQDGGGYSYKHQWHHSRNRFFDRDTTPIYDIRKWFLTFVEDTPGRDNKYGWG